MAGLPTKRTGTVRLDKAHVLLPHGKIYCREYGDSEIPLVSHSRVKCALCGKTVQTSSNPRRNPARYYPGGLDVVGEKGRSMAVKVYRGASMMPHTADRVRVDYMKNPAPLIVREIRKGMMDGLTPAQALRAAGRRFAGRVPAAALRGALAGLKAEMLEAVEQSRDGMSDWAKGAAQRLMAYRKFSHNNPRVSMGWMDYDNYESQSKAVAEAQYLKNTKGYKVRVKLMSVGQAATRTGGPWLVQVWSPLPERNPPRGDGPVQIYGQTQKIFMRKTEGPYKGQRFVHDFKPGVKQMGLPRGTVIQTPDGRTFRASTRIVALHGKKDLWRNFPA